MNMQPRGIDSRWTCGRCGKQRWHTAIEGVCVCGASRVVYTRQHLQEIADAPKAGLDAGATLSYTDWIAAAVPAASKGMCTEYSLLMKLAFPELVLQRGTYFDHKEGEEWDPYTMAMYHYWLETPSGAVVDPTISQFRHQDGAYEADELPDVEELMCLTFGLEAPQS